MLAPRPCNCVCGGGREGSTVILGYLASCDTTMEAQRAYLTYRAWLNKRMQPSVCVCVWGGGYFV